MKIEKITLSKQELIEEDGEFILKEIEEEVVPCVITNRALQISRDEGNIETSLITDLTKAGEGIDIGDDRILKAIYVGYVGGQILKGQKEPKYSFDEFIKRYNDTTTEKAIVYAKLIMAEKDNNFANDIEKNISKKKDKGEKK